MGGDFRKDRVMTKRRRVVVTGMGVVSPLGDRATEFIDALIEGRSGVRSITVFDTASLPTRVAGEAPLPVDVPLGDRKIAFALEAGRQALLASGIALQGDTHADFGISMGVG